MSTRPITRIGVDACSLGVHRTGVANYVAPILEAMVEGRPDTAFFLYSNAPVRFGDFANVTVRVSEGSRGPVWQSRRLPSLLRADDIQVHWGTNGYLPAIGLGSIASVLTIHDLAEVYAPATQQSAVRWSRRIFQRLAARRADRVAAASHATGKAVREIYGRKVEAIVNPCVAERFRRVDHQTAQAVATRHGLDGPFLLIVATMEPRKNVALTIRTYLDRIAAGRALPPLALVGGGGWLNAEIEEVIKQGQATGRIVRLGYVSDEDLPALYSACEAFLLLSLYEGYGMPIAEAQRCGAPVVHGSHGSMVEASGRLGVAVTPDAQGIAAMFDSLAEGGAGLACRVPSDMTYSPKDAAETMWQLIDQAYSVRSA